MLISHLVIIGFIHLLFTKHTNIDLRRVQNMQTKLFQGFCLYCKTDSSLYIAYPKAIRTCFVPILTIHNATLQKWPQDFSLAAIIIHSLIVSLFVAATPRRITMISSIGPGKQSIGEITYRIISTISIPLNKLFIMATSIICDSGLQVS